MHSCVNIGIINDVFGVVIRVLRGFRFLQAPSLRYDLASFILTIWSAPPTLHLTLYHHNVLSHSLSPHRPLCRLRPSPLPPLPQVSRKGNLLSLPPSRRPSPPTPPPASFALLTASISTSKKRTQFSRMRVNLYAVLLPLKIVFFFSLMMSLKR